MMERVGAVVRWLLGFAKARPVVTGAVVVLLVVLLVVGELVGLPFPVTVVLYGGAAVLTLAVVWWLERRSGSLPGALSTLGVFVLVGLGTLLVIQLVPYGRAHANPTGSGEPDWATPETRELMVRSCFACHSNQVEYPWYSNVAPISWAVQRHVEEGRQAVNYSDFATNPGEAENSVEVILEGSMPPPYFTRFGLHADANLTQAEQDALVAGLSATPGLSEQRGAG
jgi:hypothetical protein